MSPNRSGRALVIYHKDFTDGACAAWAAAHHLGRAGLPEPVLLAAHPGITPEGAFAEEWAIVFVVDVCIPRADVERLGAWVLDHHKTNEPLLAGYERARFDMSRSGAGLAWDEVQAILWGLGYGVTQAARPWFVDYVEDRDLWRWALPDSRAINAGPGDGGGRRGVPRAAVDRGNEGQRVSRARRGEAGAAHGAAG